MFISPDLPTPSVPEIPGIRVDLKILIDDDWLVNTEVNYILQQKNGLWHLTMIYIATDNPMKFICRKIDSYPSLKKAQLFADILQRGIRKDARGTLKTNLDAFNIFYN